MAIGIDVYVTIVGLLAWSSATIVWAVWKKRQEEDEPSGGQTTGVTETDL